MRVFLVILVVGLLDVGVRFLAPWDFRWVILAEGVLFLAGCGAILTLERTVREASSRGRWLRRGLAVAFGLGGLRSLSWGLGAPVLVANLLTLGAGAVLAVLWWRARHRTRP